jgi:hypothetical protein
VVAGVAALATIQIILFGIGIGTQLLAAKSVHIESSLLSSLSRVSLGFLCRWPGWRHGLRERRRGT